MQRFILSIIVLASLGLSPVVHAFTMEAGTYTVAGRMLFDYQASAKADWVRNIDVVNVWQMVVTENPDGSSHVDFHTLATTMGTLPMMDGPFAGYRAAFDFSLDQLGNGNFRGTGGALSFYTPMGNVWDPDGNARNGDSEKFNTTWNGLFGDAGVYAISKTRSNNFFKWEAHDIVTFVDPGNYSLETGLFWNEYDAMQNDDDPGNDIIFSIPNGATAVPAPTSLLLIGAGLAGVVGLRRKK